MQKFLLKKLKNIIIGPDESAKVFDELIQARIKAVCSIDQLHDPIIIRTMNISHIRKAKLFFDSAGFPTTGRYISCTSKKIKELEQYRGIDMYLGFNINICEDLILIGCPAIAWHKSSYGEMIKWIHAHDTILSTYPTYSP